VQTRPSRLSTNGPALTPYRFFSPAPCFNLPAASANDLSLQILVFTSPPVGTQFQNLFPLFQTISGFRFKMTRPSLATFPTPSPVNFPSSFRGPHGQLPSLNLRRTLYLFPPQKGNACQVLLNGHETCNFIFPLHKDLTGASESPPYLPVHRPIFEICPLFLSPHVRPHRFPQLPLLLILVPFSYPDPSLLSGIPIGSLPFVMLDPPTPRPHHVR